MNRALPTFNDYFLLVLLAAIFGASFMLTKIAVAEIPAASLVALRLVIASAMFLWMMKMAGQKLPTFGKVWLPIAGTALFGNAAPFLLIAWGQEKVDAGLAAILMATMPLMTIVIAHFFTRDEKLTPFKIVGFCLGLLGVAYMIGFDKLATLGEETVRQYAITLGALCYAISAIITKSIVHLPRLAMVSALMLLSTLMIIPIILLNGELVELYSKAQIFGLSWNAIIAGIVLGILPTAIGTMLVFKIVARQGASFLSQINFMVPVFGVVWAMIFLGEILPANALIAMALILAGVGIARIDNKKHKVHSKEQAK